MEHQIELGAEVLHGKQSNNPLYQLAEEHHLIDIDNSKFRISTEVRVRRVQEFLDPDPTRTRSNKFLWTRTRSGRTRLFNH